ncbi:F-box/FBD/LRR-repeat protein At3g26920-like [Silene latifolia]|uniref:F-box/FBD/LRR-repeat protein At3g26920-like n=1 Tax=Silene latifolia TaxID=37657 RepID=UPI003D7773C7
MNSDCEETVSGQLNTMDRFSDLPDFLVHHIISFLDTKEAYRTCILSERWAHISATNPIIEFHYYCKAEYSPARHWPSQEDSGRLLGYIDTRMQRYATDNLRIKTLKLRFPASNKVFGCDVEDIELLELSRKLEELSCKVDEWIRIAVRNQVARLDLDGPINYQLPAILLSAKSLREVYCINVKIPYYNGAINLASLQTLELLNVGVEERMLNHIISSCLLLKCLSVKNCPGFKTIVIPWCSQVRELTLREALQENGTIILETSCLIYIKLSDMYDDRWPVISKPGLLRNLRTLDIVFMGITDEDLNKLLPELASLENLRLTDCDKLTMIRISSIQLKKIYLNECFGLLEVTIDAPSMTKFEYKGEFYPHRAITISSQASCDLSLSITPDCLDNEGFFKLKKLMTGLRSCNALEIWLENYTNEAVCDNIEFNEEELGDVNLGLPHDITELMLTLYYMKLSRSSVSAFLNGLFWTCHPDIISLRFHLKDPDLMIQLFMNELEDMVNCWEHPLKRIEFPDANCSNILESEKVDAQLRLHW